MAAKIFPVGGTQNSGGGDFNSYIDSLMPGTSKTGSSALSVIDDMLAGNVSPSVARNANAAFGVESGMPGSEFVRNRGYDLYNQQGQQRQQQGVGDFLSFLQGTSQPGLQFRGQNFQNQQAQGQLGLGQQQLNEESTQNAFQRWLQSQQLGLNAANTGANYLNSFSQFLR